MKYENFSVKAYELQKGVEKLLKYGMETFDLYADEVDMSLCDRNRVIAKCKRAWGKTELEEMACPENVIGERWEYYIKLMRYSPDRTRRLLKLTDDSYKNQFIPDPDINSSEIFQGV